MDDWVDYLLIDNESDLQSRLSVLSTGEKNHLGEQLRELLGLSQEAIERAVLRLLIERARPFALPARLWRREVTATWSVQDANKEHLMSLQLDPTADRLQAMQDLYFRFANERKPNTVLEESLRKQNYSCLLCGLRFYNDELDDFGYVSPLGKRPRIKMDPLKPHWSKKEFRRASVEHRWPISLFGDNSTRNLAITCFGCNTGKSNYMAAHQTKAFVGLPLRSQLRETGVLPVETFFAQMQRQPHCQDTGRGPAEVELTVRLLDARHPPVLDNLVTISSED
jgi:hypothetical protein